MKTNQPPSHAPLWLWAWLAPVMVAVHLSVRWFAPGFFPAWASEIGPVELGTALLLFPAVYFGVSVVRQRARLPGALLPSWYGIVSVGCFYLAGEELSWGQHLVGWETPQWLAERNDQNETNIHNISGLFDQQPRLLLELWVLVSLLVATARVIGQTGRDPNRASHWFWGWQAVIPAALLAILIRLPERIGDWTAWTRPPPFDIRLSELQEFCFAVFLLVYLWEVRGRLQSLDSAGPRPQS